MTAKRSGGQLLIDCQLNFGAEKAFGVPGESYLAALDALHDTKTRLDSCSAVMRAERPS